MTSQVFYFNAAATPVTLQLNGGTTQYTATAANTSTWVPGVPPTNPPFSGSTPEQNNFGFGVNKVTVFPGTGGDPATIDVTVPTTVNPAASLQLYVFYKDANTADWVLLSMGTPVSGNFTP